jgi:glycosyltransferase involved in cell wall biosynthesis
VIRVAFDMRDPIRSGIARVARCMPQAFAAGNSAAEFEITVAGPPHALADLGVDRWVGRPRVVPWEAGRLSPWSDLSWPAVDRAVGDAVWYFPHWDMPWLARPRRSVALVNDVIPLVVPGATSRARSVLARRWIRRSALKATRVAVSTAYTRTELVEIWPDLADRTRVVPLGVDGRFFSTPIPLPPAIRSLAEAPFMLSVGNRKAHKNLAMGPEVLARVAGIHWIVVGEFFPAWDAVIQRAAKLGVANRIHVLESQPDEVVHALYAGAVCLFFPSRNEGFGLPILEALAAGSRVVIGRAGASVEVLGGHGAVCDLDDADAFASAVQDALRAGPPGKAGRSHAMTFTWERSARVLAEIVREIAR